MEMAPSPMACVAPPAQQMSAFDEHLDSNGILLKQKTNECCRCFVCQPNIRGRLRIKSRKARTSISTSSRGGVLDSGRCRVLRSRVELLGAWVPGNHVSPRWIGVSGRASATPDSKS